eukprot:scaffold10.g2400.t1
MADAHLRRWSAAQQQRLAQQQQQQLQQQEQQQQEGLLEDGPEDGALPGRGRTGSAAAAWSDDGGDPDPMALSLVRDKAVMEMAALKGVINDWMEQYEQRHGHKPELSDAAAGSPEVYRAFMRLVALREMLQGLDASGA